MESVGFFGIFEESRRIISAHSRHFLGLSALFLLPIAFLNCAASTFRKWVDIDAGPEELLRSTARPYGQYHRQEFLPFSTGFSGANKAEVIFLTLHTAVIFALALCSNAAVTHSICNGFFGRAVKLPSAIKSIPGSVWRLMFTTVCAVGALVGVWIGFIFIWALGVWGLSAFNIHVASMLPVREIAFVFIGLVAMYLQVHWVLASVIPVAEGSWGLEPLRRSSYLVKGMRRMSFSLNLFFAIAGLVLALWANYLQSSASDSLDLLSKIVQSITVLAAMTVLFLYNIATNTVFYMYCKAHHDELLGAIMEEFAQDYIILPFQDQKILRVVTVAEP